MPMSPHQHLVHHPHTLLPRQHADISRGGTGARLWLDVFGGLCAVIIVALLSQALVGELFTGQGWGYVIGWESVWFIAALACAPLLPSGIRHDISWRTTIDGLRLDWPELIYGTYIFGSFAVYMGGVHLALAPVGMALAVGAAEEFIFRVVVLGWLVTKLDVPRALLISSLLFGAAHLHEFSVVGLLSVVPQTAGGMILGAIYLRTRNPLGPILAHAYWDLPYFLLLGAGVSGGGTEAGMPTVLSLVPWIGFGVYGLWLVRDGMPAAGRIVPLLAQAEATAHRADVAPQ